MEIGRTERRVVTGAVMGVIFLSAMDVTAVSPAMPKIVGALGGGAFYAWAFSVYLVLSTTTTPVFGRLADRRGRKPVILAGIGLFLLGSVASGAAPTMPLFIAARALQGLGAGALLPTAFTIVGDLYDLEGRARIQGWLSGVWGVASILGPLVGGTLVDTVGWRWIFFMNIPIGLAAAWLIHTKLREEGYPRPGAGLDLVGGSVFSGAVLLLLAGLKLEGALKVAALATAFAATVAFLWRERRDPDPLFDLSLFKIPVYRAANVSGFFGGAVLFGLTAFLPVYVMNVRGGDALESGLILTPLSFGWVSAATLSGRLLVRHGARRVVGPGLIVLTLATFGVSHFGLSSPLPWVAFLMFATGVGFGLSFTTFLVAVQEEVGVERRGQGTSGVQFFRQIGGALGVAVLEVVYLAHLDDHSLLEARPGRVLSPGEISGLVSGFDSAFLLATGFAALATLVGLLAFGRTRYPAGTK